MGQTLAVVQPDHRSRGVRQPRERALEVDPPPGAVDLGRVFSFG
jgi:hypothetical protein